ncbi:hypothetical protein [Allomuricauda sp. SCSIO 65647]|uniref:hypothetical protein n=1 Tax=Allomuricauda sp. SCSIO 65647 TaxID=2908843 RepID=UPI001F2933BF|nr:hypothetical protein [Muricauda sp. SCSIO 65647]UJH66593.1 hypothetical protein L0P89_11540 [Muricauda sp. SCSIO 65647]
MNHLLEEYWEDLKWEALITWERLTLSDLDQVAGNIVKLEKLIQKKYGHSVWESKKQIIALVQRYDNLAFLTACDQLKEQLPKFWPDLKMSDIEHIHCSRTRLLHMIKKNGRSREQAMEEINRFLRQFID